MAIFKGVSMPSTFSQYRAAMVRGFTKRIWIYAGHSEILALVKPDVDFDGWFKAYDVQECEYLRICGWNCEYDTGESF